jgi:hypothetical protein
MHLPQRGGHVGCHHTHVGKSNLMVHRAPHFLLRVFMRLLQVAVPHALMD